MASDEIQEYAQDLLGVVAHLENGKYAKQFLREEGGKLNKLNKQHAKEKLGKKTRNFLKGFKRGKPYIYNGTGSPSIRAYNKAPHAHLLDLGHRIVGKDGSEHGFKEGEHFMDSAFNEFDGTYIEDSEKFLDKLLSERRL